MPATERAEPRPSAAFETGDEGRLGEAVLEPSRDDADDAGVPAFLRRKQERSVGLMLGKRDRLIEDHLLDRLAFAIVGFERGRQLLRGGCIRRGQQFDAERATADAAARIDARTEADIPDDRA